MWTVWLSCRLTLKTDTITVLGHWLQLLYFRKCRHKHAILSNFTACSHIMVTNISIILNWNNSHQIDYVIISRGAVQQLFLQLPLQCPVPCQLPYLCFSLSIWWNPAYNVSTSQKSHNSTPKPFPLSGIYTRKFSLPLRKIKLSTIQRSWNGLNFSLKLFHMWLTNGQIF